MIFISILKNWIKKLDNENDTIFNITITISELDKINENLAKNINNAFNLLI